MNVSVEPSKNTKDYRNKGAGQKAAILVAGAAFNIIFTILAFTLCFSVGMDLEPPRVGDVMPGTPIAEAKLHPTLEPANLQKGDLIHKINDVPVKSFLEAQLEITSSRRSNDLWLEVEQPAGSGVIKHVIVKPAEDARLGASTIGLEPYNEEMPLPLGFVTKDQLVVIEDPLKDSPSIKAGLRKGDIITALNGKTDPVYMDFIRVIRSSGGKPLDFVIERAGKIEKLTITPEKKDKDPYFLIGVKAGPYHRQVTDIDESSEAYKGGLRKGYFVTKFSPKDRVREDGKQRWVNGTVLWSPAWEIDVEKNTRTTVTVPKEGPLVFKQEYRYTEFYQREGFTGALGQAWDDTLRFSRNIFQVLVGLFRGDVKVTALSGAGGIGHAMFNVAKYQDFLNFFWFLAFISLNLGVMQFVPIPVLDGGQLVMVLIEKLKGSPINAAIQEKFQWAGLLIVGGLLLLTTFMDIKRFLGM